MAELTRVHPSMLKDAFFFNTFLIGAIIPVMATSTYVPFGCLYCDAGEYTRELFIDFYDNYLLKDKLLTCTYTEYAAQVALTGNCMKFAVDGTAKKFKVPYIKDGDSITQASSAAELGKSVKAGLPNIKGKAGGVVSNPLAADTNTGPFKTVANTTESLGGWTGSATHHLEIDANQSSAIYQDGITTVLTEQVRLRHFVVVANAQNNTSVFDWSNYMAGLAGKMNADGSNADLSKCNIVLQQVRYETGAVATGSTAIPSDDTAPQNTEGTQVMSLTFTPKLANSVLKVEVLANAAPATVTWVSAALFRDANTSAVAACSHFTTTNGVICGLKLSHTEPAGAITPTTFSVRVGATDGSVTTFNGSAGSRKFGGVLTSSIVITEYAV